jgi:hypothetical protein
VLLRDRRASGADIVFLRRQSPGYHPAGTCIVINATYACQGMTPALSNLGVGTINQPATVCLE